MKDDERKELQNLNDRKRLLENEGKELSLDELKKWESLTMKQAIEEQKDSLERRDEAFWGYVDKLVPRDSLGHGYHLQQLLTCEIPDKENPEKRVSYSPMKRLGVLEDRYAMIGMFALMKGMTLDQVLSEDPELDAQKFEIGKEFIETMRFKDRETYAKDLKEEFLKSETKTTSISNICKTWIEAMQKDGIDARRPRGMKGEPEMITFFHEKCQNFFKDNQKGISAEAQKKFIEEMKTTGKIEYADSRDFGKRYGSYLSEHNYHVSEVLQEMHDTFAKLSSDFIVNTDIPSLSKNIKKIAFVTQVCKSMKECRHEDVIKEAYDEDENTNKLDEKEEQTKSVRKIRIFQDYCDYVATDDYIKDTKLDSMGQGRIYKAYWAKTEMDLIASKCEKTETLGEVGKELYTHNAGKKMSEQKDAFIDALWESNYSDKEWVAKANAYIRTGENPVHFYNQDNQMLPSQPDESWKDFEVLDFNEESKLESKGTLMSWKELELEEKKSKSSRHKPTRSVPVKTEEMKKEKSTPKLEKK